MTNQTERVAILGANGFIGQAVVEALKRRGAQVRTISIGHVRASHGEALSSTRRQHPLSGALDKELEGISVVINCAGNPDASSTDIDELWGANALLPALLAEAVTRNDVKRFVHVSSAVVQGRSLLDSSEPPIRGFSPYADSKIHGERSVLALASDSVTVYRPPSVHAPGRRITQQISWLSRHGLGIVAAPPSSHSPQALLPNVADAIATLALTPEAPPTIVHHPWEGVTTGGLLTQLGNRAPIVIPRSMAMAFVAIANSAAHIFPRLSPYVRRIEVVMLGQEQADSWLTASGWTPPVPMSAWSSLSSPHERAKL